MPKSQFVATARWTAFILLVLAPVFLTVLGLLALKGLGVDACASWNVCLRLVAPKDRFSLAVAFGFHCLIMSAILWGLYGTLKFLTLRTKHDCMPFVTVASRIGGVAFSVLFLLFAAAPLAVLFFVFIVAPLIGAVALGCIALVGAIVRALF